MARQTGLIQLRGSIGNMRNYKLSGDKFITSALKGGPSPEDVANLPSMENCRLRNKEWEGCMVSSSYVLGALLASNLGLYDRFLSGRVAERLNYIVNRDSENPFGQRNILISANMPQLAMLVLHPNHKISEAIFPEYQFFLQKLHDIDRTTIQLNMTFPSIAAAFNFKGNETHVQATTYVCAVPDIIYSSYNRSYAPISPGFPSLNYQGSSAWLAKSDITTDSFDISVDCSASAGFWGDDASVLQYVVIRFSRLIGEQNIPSNHYAIFIGDIF